jgi:hypothetical protein
MNNHQKKRKKNEQSWKKVGKKDTWWKIEEKTMKNDEK